MEQRDIQSPGGSHRDVHDHARLRHARDRHNGFPVGQYLQAPPMLFSRDAHNVFLGDMYRGNAAFLICGGPSLRDHDLSLLQQRGILSLAVNNAAAVVRPTLWTSVDDPGNFTDSIWRDPGILKFVPLCHMEKTFRIRDAAGKLVPSTDRVGDMPAVFGFRRNENFVPDQWLYEDTFNWGNHSELVDSAGNKGSRSVFYVALRLLFYLGVRKVFLIGCDFRMADGKRNYAFDQDRSRSAVSNNNETFHILNVRLEQLKPHFDKAGFKVFNCTPESGLKVFPALRYEDALAQSCRVIPPIKTEGMYEFNQQMKDVAKAKTKAKPKTDGGQKQSLPPDLVAEPSSVLVPSLLGTTLITFLDSSAAPKLRVSLPVWKKHQSWLADLDMLIVHDSTWDPATQMGDLAKYSKTVRTIRIEVGQEEDRILRRSHAVLSAIACEVRTPWCTYIDPGVMCGGPNCTPVNDWFMPDSKGRNPVLVAHRWGYSKPSDSLALLDDWADQLPGLKSYPRLNVPSRTEDGCVRHAAIQTWLMFIQTDWARQLLKDVPDRLPCASLATFLAYCGSRRGDNVVRVNLKKHGWQPVSCLNDLRRQASLLLGS
ncbi:MAG: hypothetical protein K8T89_10545 [Planctomycetes bacterium]|nr:hypothetical protein [Planctomycetota bacterium]